MQGEAHGPQLESKEPLLTADRESPQAPRKTLRIQINMSLKGTVTNDVFVFMKAETLEISFQEILSNNKKKIQII